MPRLPQVLQALDKLAPLRLAAPWDNVGLLVEGRDTVRSAGVCIDLTEAVLDELLDHGVDLIVAYHPTLFKGMKRLTSHTGLERVVRRVIRADVSLYAPHTALDAAPDGMGDWLTRGLGATTAEPLEPDALDPTAGLGRRGTLPEPAALADLLDDLKAHLGLTHLRTAGDLHAPRRTFATCPGAGGSLFEGLTDVDLYLTGEMRHHDVLAKVAGGAAVVLTDHTNTERGYLPTYVERLAAALPDVTWHRSTVDADPLVVR